MTVPVRNSNTKDNTRQSSSRVPAFSAIERYCDSRDFGLSAFFLSGITVRTYSMINNVDVEGLRHRPDDNVAKFRDFFAEHEGVALAVPEVPEPVPMAAAVPVLEVNSHNVPLQGVLNLRKHIR